MKRTYWNKSVFSALLAACLLVALGGAPGVQAADDDMTSRITDYFRRKQNLPPEVEATIKDIGDSKIPGAKQATLELSRGNQTQNVGILMSEDGRYVVFGTVEDVTSDPFAEIAKKITTKGQPTRGPKDAPITIVEFSDFQCPYCARAHATVKDQVLKEYGDKVRLVYKNFALSFHKWAEIAAVAGECAFEQDEKAFWVLYDYYFENQRELNPENVEEKTIEALANTKVDTAKLKECTAGEGAKERVQQDMAEGQQVGISGTPAFVINGRTISGAQPFEKFKDIIDDELKRMEQKG